MTQRPFIRIIHGDCRDQLAKLKPESVHLVITDPPYFLDGLDGAWKKGTKDSPRATGTIGGLPVGMKFDPQQGVRLQQFIGHVGALLHRVMVPGAFAVFFSQPRLAHRMAVGLEDAGFNIRDLLAWHFTTKAQFKAFSHNHFIDKMPLNEKDKVALKKSMDGLKTPQLRPQFETMILAQKKKQGTSIDNWQAFGTGFINANESLDGKAPSTVMVVEKPKKETYNSHLTVKPLVLKEHLIKLLSSPHQVVLDPFLGSGTTALAANNTQRSCIGIEIHRDYVSIAQQRLKTTSI
ncbi:MAG: site-specific DNA-methyltransferase [Alphaproteobacteria bacterium GM202ARS2]|nr:site-specific DNA-methyltransferase [Alphaproteobacteria bacterium GM202ARS2]